MTQITISLDDAELAHVHALARARGLSVEEWAREAITRNTDMRPRDPLFGLYTDEPAVTEAIDEVVGQRHQTSLRAP